MFLPQLRITPCFQAKLQVSAHICPNILSLLVRTLPSARTSARDRRAKFPTTQQWTFVRSLHVLRDCSGRFRDTAKPIHRLRMEGTPSWSHATWRRLGQIPRLSATLRKASEVLAAKPRLNYEVRGQLLVKFCGLRPPSVQSFRGFRPNSARGKSQDGSPHPWISSESLPWLTRHPRPTPRPDPSAFHQTAGQSEVRVHR